MNAEPYEEETEEYYPPQPTLRSSRVYAPPTQRQTEAAAPKPPRKRRSFVPTSIGMFIVVGALLIFQHVIAPSYAWASDQWHYGDTRITQLDADVGHSGTSHFIAQYYNSSIIIVELPLRNPQQFHTYVVGGFIGGTPPPVVSLTIADINHDGKPDLLVHVEGTAIQTVLFNTGDSFRMGGA